MSQNHSQASLSSNYTTICFLSILIIGSFLRIMALGDIPQGFSCDEASFGYESFSILETLRDRYGKFLPPFLQLFGNDYPASLYVLATVPFIKVLGMTEFSTRIVAAITGSLTIFAVYFLTEELFSKRVSIFAALLLAINPWHIHYSRIAFNLVFLPLFFCMALLFLMKSFRKPNYIAISSLFFGISLYTYSSARVFISLFVLGLILMFRKHLWNHKKQTFIAALLFLLIFIPLFRFWISPEGMARARGTGLVSHPLTIALNYFSHFSPNFLFFQGSSIFNENPARIGELYFFELITVALGIFKLISAEKKVRSILLLWLCLYPLPAAFVALASPQRSIVGAPLFAIISAYGLTQLIDLFRLKQKAIILGTTLVLVASLLLFSYRYFINPSSDAAKLWNYGIKDAIKFASKSSYAGFVMSSDTNSSCFAIYDFVAFIPFYTYFPPQEYQRSPIPPWIRGSRDKVYSLGKYYLMSIGSIHFWQKDSNS
ncbi:glycosyltransferase family 39 protein [Nostoc sp. TCL26-01]|uniref:ArnT family glycosyltransferase n=1 Tax=Nostoc sp. TCL26-01 TaxID=2576904 RepID=UPI0015B9CDC0|nr:glycosyltransferase family 39 protein [Nostoc sp. TCL26-01]QLE58126.1 phospholipid carrier-dependent glycosyltransferase [Nostoc sp. TCL26-01]